MKEAGSVSDQLGAIAEMTESELFDLVEDQGQWNTLSVGERDAAKTRYLSLKRERYLLERRSAAQKLELEASQRNAIAIEEELRRRRDEVRLEWEAAWDDEREALESRELTNPLGPEVSDESDPGVVGIFGGILVLALLVPGVVWLVQFILDAANGDRWATWPDALAYSLGVGKPLEQVRFCAENNWACGENLALHWYFAWPFAISVPVLLLMLYGAMPSKKDNGQ